MKKLSSKFNIRYRVDKKHKCLVLQHDWNGMVLEHRIWWDRITYTRHYLPF